MPLILLPSFFTSAISQALLPIVSSSFNNKKYISKKIKQAIFFSLLISIPATLIFVFIPEIPLKLIYNTNQGINYIKVLAPICLLHYIQSPLQAMGLAKEAMNGTLVSMVLRTISLFIFYFFRIGIWGLIISISINIIYVTIHHIVVVRKNVKEDNF